MKYKDYYKIYRQKLRVAGKGKKDFIFRIDPDLQSFVGNYKRID